MGEFALCKKRDEPEQQQYEQRQPGSGDNEDDG